MSPVDLSVIIPAHDAAEVLYDQLGALATQRASIRWEVVVADNRSTDRTAEVARSWSGSVPALTVLDASSRLGPGHARNVAAASASGDILAFCDADDLVCEGWVQAFYDALQEADAATGPVLDVPAHCAEAWQASGWSTAPRLIARHAPYLPTHNMALRAEVFRACGGFDEQLLRWQDVDLSLRVFQHGTTAVFAPDARVQRWVPSQHAHLARKFFAYGEGARAVYVKHGGFVRRDLLFRPGHWSWWIASRAPAAVVSDEHRRQWVKNVAWGSGWLWETVKPSGPRQSAEG
jgi:glycosyltransferase involved in cell wall biosynthesis